MWCDKNAPVAAATCDAYNGKELDAKLLWIAQSCGLSNLSGKKILVKPNILRDALPEKAISTHPLFAAAVVRVLKQLGAGSDGGSIIAGDSPAFQKSGFSGKLCGLKEAFETEGALWVDFTDGKEEYPVSHGKKEQSFKLTSHLKGVDLIINLPKLKTHQLMLFTGAVKNLFGLVPSLGKSPYHVKYSSSEGFAVMLADLLSVVPPTFSFMDGIIGMEGPGPNSGDPRQLSLILGSWNPGNLDAVAASHIGYKSGTLPLEKELIQRGAASRREEIALETDGALPEQPRGFKLISSHVKSNLVRDIFLQSFAPKLAIKLRPRPHFLHDRCIRCGECISICAAKALTRKATPEAAKPWQVAIDPGRCIRCYCCHEICPADAIEIR
jgi:uncharacterized protein (DUF362 family)/NAD-dependent dihydropyrimidine dehydrogenase PreA subunit